jgi:hypothetical protein
VGSRLEKVSSSRLVGASMAFFWAPGCSSYLLGVLGTDVDNALDDSWRGSFTMWLYLAAKPSHVEVDVAMLAYPLICM